MIMHLKNKFHLALTTLIEECKKKKGIPDFVEVDPSEAWNILKEYKEYGDSDFSFKRIGGGTDAVFWIKTSNLSDQNVAKPIIASWIRGEIEVHFKKIPLKVMKAKKTVEETEKEWDDKLIPNK